MNKYIALFRGINVGGKNLLPMKELAAILEDLGVPMTDRNWRTVCKIREMAKK